MILKLDCIRQSCVINLMINEVPWWVYSRKLCATFPRKQQLEPNEDSIFAQRLIPFNVRLIRLWSTSFENHLCLPGIASGCVACWSMMNDILMRQKQKVFVVVLWGRRRRRISFVLQSFFMAWNNFQEMLSFVWNVFLRSSAVSSLHPRHIQREQENN